MTKKSTLSVGCIPTLLKQKMKLLVVAAALMSGGAQGQITVTLTPTSTSPWTVPTGVTSILVQCWGGGGAGGSANSTSTATIRAGGGAGGSYAGSTLTELSSSYVFSVGAGGLAPVSPTAFDHESLSGSGGETNFGSGTIIAKGGGGAKNSHNATASNSGGVAPIDGNTGTTKWYGGNGSTGTSISGSGGGSAGSTGNGGNAGGSTAGTGGTGDGVIGAAGRGGNGDGNSGGSPGAGGGGAQANGPTYKKGGSGGAGQIKITLNSFTSIATGTTLTVGVGETMTIPNGTTFTVDAGAQIINNGTITNNGTLTVNGTISNIGSSYVDGTGTFNLNSGATINVSHTVGLNPTTGPIRCTTRSFNTGANYVFNGTAAQVPGTDFPTTVNNLTIDNAAGVTLSAALTVSGATTITGKLILGNTLTANGALTVGTIGTLQLNNTEALAGSGTVSYTAGGTLAFNRTSVLTIAGSETYWPTSNGPTNISVLQNTVTLNADRTVSGTTSITGTLILGSTLTANGVLTVGAAGTLQLNNNGVLAGSGTLSYTAGGTLAFNKTSATTINSTAPIYWPTSNGPTNISLMQNSLTLDVAKTISGRISLGGTLTANATLTIGAAGTLQIQNNGVIAGSGTVTYASGGTLAFNKTTSNTISDTETYWPAINGPTNISITGNTMTLNANKTITGATVASGATLAVSGNKQLTATTLTNNGTVTLKSDANGTATLMPASVTGSGTFKVDQYLLTGRNWYLSSPVAAATAPATGIANYYEYVEAGNNDITGQPGNPTLFWKGIATGTPLAVGTGYIAKATGLTTIQFTGALNNNASYPITLKKATNGFNLVGNPYPAFLNWASVYAANAAANMPTGTVWYRSTNYNGKSAWATGTVYAAGAVVYNGSSFYSTVLGGTSGATAPTGTTTLTNYSDGGITDWQYQGSVYVFATVNSLGTVTTHNATNLIPPMQAFWVQTGTDASILTISKSQTLHNNTGSAIVIKAPKSENNAQQLARLQLSNNATVDEAIVYFNANASNGFDSYDSPKMFSNKATTPEIYTQVGDEKLVINGYKSVADVTEVPLGFATQQAGSFTLKLNEFTNFDSAARVLLTDATKPGVTFDLTDGSAYPFTAAVTPASTNRFSLLFRAPGSSTGIENTSKPITQVYVNANNQITIIAAEKSNYSIYNAVGQLINNGFTNAELQTVNYKLQTGVYVVKINGATTKVIIK